MKTKRIIKEADQLIKEINQRKKKEKFLESTEFELMLVDDLLKEIKQRNLNEGFLDFIKGLWGGFADFVGAGMREVLGLNEETYTTSTSSNSKKLGVTESAADLDPDKNPKHLMVWAGSQGFVKTNLDSIEEKLQRVNVLKSGQPHQSDDEEETEKWNEGGDYYNIAKDLSTAAGSARGLAKSIGSDTIGKLKAFVEIEAEAGRLIDDEENENVGKYLRAIEVVCEPIANGVWSNTMKKAAIVKEEDFKDSGVEIKYEEAITKAEMVRSLCEEERNRLLAADKSKEAANPSPPPESES